MDNAHLAWLLSAVHRARQIADIVRPAPLASRLALSVLALLALLATAPARAADEGAHTRAPTSVLATNEDGDPRPPNSVLAMNEAGDTRPPTSALALPTNEDGDTRAPESVLPHATGEEGDTRPAKSVPTASEEDAPARAPSVLAEAERDDDALAFGKALAGYDEALRLAPAMAGAMRAQQRGAALRARSEGDFEPLAKLERVRRDPELSSDPSAIDDLVRAAESFPPGLVRVEVWLLAAEAYAGRLDRPGDAVPLWRRIIVDPHADEVVTRAAARSLVQHHLERGDLAAAEAALALAGSNAHPTLADEVRRAARRRWVHLSAIAVVGLTIVLATSTIGQSIRARRHRVILARARSSSRLVLGYAAYVALAGAALASCYEAGTAHPFLLFGAVLVPLLLLARAWGAAGSPAPRARGLRAIACAASALGTAFLVLEHVDVRYLQRLGL